MSDIQQRLRDGYAALTAGRFDVAMNACREMLARDPKCVPAHFLVGLIGVRAQRSEDCDQRIRFGDASAERSRRGVGAACTHVAASGTDRATPSRRWGVHLRSAAPIRSCRTCSVRCSVCGAIALRPMRGIARAAAARPDVAALSAQSREQSDRAWSRGAMRSRRSTPRSRPMPDNAQAHWMLANVAYRDVDRTHRANGSAARQARRAAGCARVRRVRDRQGVRRSRTMERRVRCVCARRRREAFDDRLRRGRPMRARSTRSPRRSRRSGARANAPGCADASPIFVIGQPRTGTTLVERIITSHSQVHSAGELQQFAYCGAAHDGHRRCAAPLRPRSFALPPTSTRRRSASCICGSTTHLRGTQPRFVDKLPINYLYVGLIAKALPNARIVHVVRDPIDSCFASYKQLFADAYFHSYDQREMARHHVRYRRLMDHWRARVAGAFHRRRIRRRVADLEREARRVRRASGVAVGRRVSAFHRTVRPSATASAIQVREPVYRRSVARWRCYETQLQPMIERAARGAADLIRLPPVARSSLGLRLCAKRRSTRSQSEWTEWRRKKTAT